MAAIVDLQRMGSPERSFAWVVGALAIVAAAFWSTSAAMVSVWNSSGTYSHGFFIVPAFLWLVWGRRQALAALPIQPSWWALAVLAALGAVWMASHWMAMALPSQVAMVAMVPAVIAAAFGIAWVRALLFPLAFLFFAVPFGESLVPVLMDWTADFTVAALKLSGVPVYRDGLHFAIPSGNWSVVDSCSGIRYLFACLTVSSLYAWTIYRGAMRRLAFIAIAVAIAVVANWVRAYGIVMLAHMTNNEIATGVDHLVYGGVFFGVIMALIFMLGIAWREPEAAHANDRAAQAQQGGSHAAGGGGPALSAALLSLTTLLVWPALSLGSASPPGVGTIVVAELRPQHGWARISDPISTWRPVLSNPLLETSLSFAKGPHKVGVHVGIYGRSTRASKLTSGLNRLLEPDGANERWKLAQQGVTRTHLAGAATDVATGVLRGSGGHLLVWQWYWVDGKVTASRSHAAMLQLLARLSGRDRPSAWVSIHTAELGDPAQARALLEAFVAEVLPTFDLADGPPALADMQARE